MNRISRCQVCNKKGFISEYSENRWWFAYCGSKYTYDGKLIKIDKKYYFICPRCGNLYCYTIKEQHKCKFCGYESMLQTEYDGDQLKDILLVKSPSQMKEFKNALRYKYAINSSVFNKEYYKKLQDYEYEESIKNNDEEEERQWKKTQEDKLKLHCPKCNSTNITTGQRGYSLFSGFLGTSQTVNRCGNCGYKLTPNK